MDTNNQTPVITVGIAPVIGLVNPKFPHNVGKAVRAASCFGIKQIWFSGDRVSLRPYGKKYRLPREERMRATRRSSFGTATPSLTDSTKTLFQLRSSCAPKRRT